MQTQIDLLKKYSLPIRGRMGQHLLVDPNIQRKIVDCLDLKPGEWVFEIGPGLGALTGALLERGAKVLAVEKDPRFVPILREEWGNHGELEVVESDILDFDFKSVFKNRRIKTIKVAGNLPYYITAPILFYLVENSARIESAVLMMQKEVAQRIMASPGSKDYGRLTLAMHYAAQVKHAFDVGPACFTPRPEVSSSVLEFKFRSEAERLEPALEKRMFRLIEIAFSQRRKTLLSLLKHYVPGVKRENLEEIFKNQGWTLTVRGEELLLKDFLVLAGHLKEVPSKNKDSKS